MYKKINSIMEEWGDEGFSKVQFFIRKKDCGDDCGDDFGDDFGADYSSSTTVGDILRFVIFIINPKSVIIIIYLYI